MCELLDQSAVCPSLSQLCLFPIIPCCCFRFPKLTNVFIDITIFQVLTVRGSHPNQGRAGQSVPALSALFTSSFSKGAAGCMFTTVPWAFSAFCLKIYKACLIIINYHISVTSTKAFLGFPESSTTIMIFVDFLGRVASQPFTFPPGGAAV